MWKWSVNFPQCLPKWSGRVGVGVQKWYYLIKTILSLPEGCQKENFKTHHQPSPLLELHSVIVHLDFQLLCSAFMWPTFCASAVTAVLVIVIILFVAAAVLVFIAVTIAVDRLDVDFREVCWQIPGQNQHVRVLSFRVVSQSVESFILSLSVTVFLYFTLIKACGEGRENQKSLSLQIRIRNCSNC